MLKNIFYTLLFIGLVIGLAYLMAVYLPYHNPLPVHNCGADTTELRQLQHELAAEVNSLKLQIETVKLELETLKQAPPPAPLQPDPPPPDARSSALAKAMLQTLNCKLMAATHSPGRLILELAVLEDILGSVAENDTLLREVDLARRETAAQIPSAVDRLEIIWKTLIAISQKAY